MTSFVTMQLTECYVWNYLGFDYPITNSIRFESKSAPTKDEGLEDKGKLAFIDALLS